MKPVERHLAQPENRIRYCSIILDAEWPDNKLRTSALKSYLFWIDKANDEEAHF